VSIRWTSWISQQLISTRKGEFNSVCPQKLQ
jgi:hypothetical protein